MKALVRKMYISILMSIFVFIVTITTTYAWMDILDYSEVKDFNLQIQEMNTDGLFISADGIHFSNSLSSATVKRLILEKRFADIDFSEYSTDEINDAFSKISELNQTYTDIEDNKLTSFKKLVQSNYGYNYSFVECDDYFQFDVYLGTTKTFDVGPHNISVYFCNTNIIYGDYRRGYLINSQTHPELGSLDKQLYVNSANATRLAVTTYDSVKLDVDELELQNDKTYLAKVSEDRLLNETSNNPKTVIYAPGSTKPVINSNGSYDFGGINDYNVGVEDYNSVYYKKLYLPDPTEFNRLYNDADGKLCTTDVKLDNNEIISVNEDNVALNLRSDRIMKVTFTFWVEGWDPDCIGVINDASINLAISLTTVKSQIEG